MDRDSLALLLAQGLSIEQIARRFGRHPSTVSYWMQKHRLQAVNRDKHLSRGGIERTVLTELVDAGKSIVAIAEAVGRSPTTVRHWLDKYGLETAATMRRREVSEARAKGRAMLRLECARHGVTDFWIEGRGSYRCLKCRREAVARRRRRVKQILVAEAGGACTRCGYDRYAGALHFHHLDPTTKRFGLAELGMARSLDSSREEARKCVLLCSNCHAEVESRTAELPIIAELPIK